MTHPLHQRTTSDHTWNLEQDIKATIIAMALDQGECQDQKLADFEQAMILIRRGLDLMRTLTTSKQESRQ